MNYKDFFLRLLKKEYEPPCKVCIHYFPCPCDERKALPFNAIMPCDEYDFGEYEPCYKGKPCRECILESDDYSGFELNEDKAIIEDFLNERVL